MHNWGNWSKLEGVNALAAEVKGLGGVELPGIGVVAVKGVIAVLASNEFFKLYCTTRVPLGSPFLLKLLLSTVWLLRRACCPIGAKIEVCT